MMLLILFSFLAGVVTILSPCILPVLPAIFAAGADTRKLRPLGAALGLAISFTFFTLTASWIVSQLGLPADVMRWVAVIVLILIGLVMMIPQLGEKFSEKMSAFASFGRKIEGKSHESNSGFISGLILGFALGLVWTPCAGPILAAIIALAATQSISSQVIFMTFAYSLGAALPMLLIAYGTRRLALGPWLDKIKKAFGALLIVAAILIAFDLPAYIQRYAAEYFPPIQIENQAFVLNQLNTMGEKDLVTGERAPEFVGLNQWINSPELTLKGLEGKVVLVDFWTYSCINCLRTLPHLNNLYEKYKDQGLTIVGVHSPEFEFEKNYDNVKAATIRYEVKYPVALDNQFKTWKAYNNRFWPAHYLIDPKGNIRFTHFGEGAYAETENQVRELLGLKPLEMKDMPDSGLLKSPETYLGYARAESYSRDNAIEPNQIKRYISTHSLEFNEVALEGLWKIDSEKITAMENGSTLSIHFLAKEVYLVLSGAMGQKIQVEIDGKPQESIVIDSQRLYSLYKGEKGSKLKLTFPEGVSAYAFTFG